MRITIDFLYDSVENLSSVLDNTNFDKEEFKACILNDLWHNYIWAFYDLESTWDEQFIKTNIDPIITNDHIDFLWNFYLANKNTIDVEILKNLKEVEEAEEHRKLSIKQYEQSIRDRYFSNSYTPPKNAKPVIYKGKAYKSKTQCCYCENITKTELSKYLNNYEKVSN